MYKSVNFYEFADAFIDYNRKDNFSYKGLKRLFEYLEEYEESTGQEIELDVVALCCDYSEASLSEVLKEYDLESLEDLQNQTTVIFVGSETEKDPLIIYQAF